METEDQRPGKVFVDVGPRGQEQSNLISALDAFQIETTKGGSSINDLTSELITAVYQLFQYEEYLMETSKYPLHDVHTKEHNRLISTMVHNLTRAGDNEELVGRIADRLHARFRVHVDNFDKVLFEYLRKKSSS